MAALNLLPKDLTPKQGVVKIAAFIKKIDMIGFSVLIATLVVLIGLYFYINSKVEESKTRQENLKIEISALEQTEVRLVLVKDRLKKANVILSANTAKDEVTNLKSLTNILPEGAEITKSNLTQVNTTLTITVANSSSLSKLLALLVSSGIYREVKLNSLNYNQLTGYSLTLELAG